MTLIAVLRDLTWPIRGPYPRLCVDFTKTVGSFGFSATIAFDAPRFHSTVAWSFLVILTESVVIRGHSFDDAVPIALANSNELKRHSGVYTLLLSTDRKLVNTTKYLWAHRDYRPWGKDVPIQCPSCCATQEKWHRVRSTDPRVYRFQCKNPHCVSDRLHQVGPYWFEVKKPKRVKMLSQGKSSKAAWTKKHLRPTPVECRRH
ncbi:hypothetical protein EV363DRAFT_1453919 [Boletus edulis]|nr:hypothetical protein EV363DRAFT_1453919 [Boletus edulis]